MLLASFRVHVRLGLFLEDLFRASGRMVQAPGGPLLWSPAGPAFGVSTSYQRVCSCRAAFRRGRPGLCVGATGMRWSRSASLTCSLPKPISFFMSEFRRGARGACRSTVSRQWNCSASRAARCRLWLIMNYFILMPKKLVARTSM